MYSEHRVWLWGKGSLKASDMKVIFLGTESPVSASGPVNHFRPPWVFCAFVKMDQSMLRYQQTSSPSDFIAQRVISPPDTCHVGGTRGWVLASLLHILAQRSRLMELPPVTTANLKLCKIPGPFHILKKKKLRVPRCLCLCGFYLYLFTAL